MNAGVIKWLMLLLLSLCLLLAGVFNLAVNGIFFMQGEKTPGTVSVIPGQTPSLVFADKYGNSYIKSFTHTFAGTLVDREPVTVIYDVRNPNKVGVNSFIHVWAIGLAMTLIGAAVVLISAVNVPWKNILSSFSGEDKRSAPSINTTKEQTKTEEVSASTISSRQAKNVNLSQDLLGDVFGPLRELIDDKEVSDIIIANHDAVYVKKGSKTTKTKITFATEARYQQIVDRMLTVSDNTLSISRPIVDGMVTPSVRIHAVHKVICEEGPYVTLRVSRFTSVKFQDLLKGTLAPREVLSYLRACLLTGHTILIAGEVGTGKTTLIRALASTIPTQESILVIEDTPEIKIEHPAVRYLRTRDSNAEGVGKVSPAECIRAGMRMAMNRIIFGEIRDPEAAESFIDVCVSGHPGMSTIHARSSFDAIGRLELLLARTQPGVERDVLKEQIGAAVQVVVHTAMCRQTGQRRIAEVLELDRGIHGEPLKTQEIFTYNVSGSMPVWKVDSKKSFYEASLREFEGGFFLNNLPDWLSLSA